MEGWHIALFVCYSAESVLRYTVERYREDMRGYNVTHSVHVEAAWPGDPVEETKWVDCGAVGLLIVIKSYIRMSS